MSATPDPTDPRATLHQLVRTGRRAEAERECVALLEVGPPDVSILVLLGGLQIDRGALAEAIETLKRAVAVDPHHAAANLQLAVAQLRQGDGAAARATLEKHVAAEPGDAVAAFHLGLLCDQAGDSAAAEARYRVALALEPGYREASLHLGLLLLRLSRGRDALPLLMQAWDASRPKANLALAIARAQLDTGAFSMAVEFARKATMLAPNAASTWTLLGTALRRTGQSLEAQDALERALELAPEDVLALAELACNEMVLGDFAKGLSLLERARTRAPDWSVLRWLDALALPTLPDDDDTVALAAQRFGRGVEGLIGDLDEGVPEIVASAQIGLERVQPFLLHYLPVDSTNLTLRYGDLIEAAMRRVVAAEWLEPVDWHPLGHAGRIRIGVVSCELRLHTVTRYFAEWLMQLDPQEFEIHAWHLGDSADAVTHRIGARVHALHHVPQASPVEVANAIREARLDVLVYLDIGMDSRPQMLAALRLAPVQCAAYGHPVTTGLRQVDWFLSGDAMEPSNAKAHYRERLERLPGLGVVPARPVEPASGEWLQREGGRPLLLCLQSLFKLTPEFDRIIARIAEATDASIVFFEFPAYCARQFRQRLARAFAERGLDIDRHVRIMQRRDYPSFLGGIAKADLVLDSIGFSGGATSLDALCVGTPVVSLEGEFMRGRQTSAMLRMLDAEELIAASSDGYIDIVVAFCRDASRRSALRARLREHRERLFDADAVMPALAGFFRRVAKLAAVSETAPD